MNSVRSSHFWHSPRIPTETLLQENYLLLQNSARLRLIRGTVDRMTAEEKRSSATAVNQPRALTATAFRGRCVSCAREFR